MADMPQSRGKKGERPPRKRKNQTLQREISQQHQQQQQQNQPWSQVNPIMQQNQRQQPQ